eukprot:gene8371-17252_t
MSITNTIISVSITSPVKVVITGSTGILGSALTKICCEQNFNVHAGYRNWDKMNIISTKLNEHSLQIIPLHMDYKDILSNNFSFKIKNDTSHYIIFNNAGVCLKGSTYNNLFESLQINSLVPIKIITNVINEYYSHDCNISIINISSGDGELSFVHTDLQHKLLSLQSIEEWFTLINTLLTDPFDTSFEYAYGDTPMYSLSKAFLNTAIRIINNQNLFLLPSNIRVLAVCPGNFQSPMTSVEDVEDILTPDDAARYVLDIALQRELFDGKSFWRRRDIIPW